MSKNPTAIARVIGKNNVIFSLSGPDDGAAATAAQATDVDESSEYQNWDSDNLWPKRARLMIEDSTTAFPLITKMVKGTFGLGLTYYKVTYDPDGNEKKDYTPEPVIDEFLEQNDVEYLMLERMMDYWFGNNCWCEYVLSKDLGKITSISHLEAEFCRFGESVDETTEFGDKIKVINNILYDSDWEKKQIQINIPYIDRAMYSKERVEQIASEKKKFSMHDCFPSPGRTLYARPAHNAIFKEKGWLKFTNSIPEIMNTINENVMDIQWHVEIPYEYWELAYEDWSTITEDVRKARIDEKIEEMEKFLAGGKNAGKAFISQYSSDPMTGKTISGWKITALDSKDKKDKFLTSIQEGDIQVTRAIGMDVSLAGIQPAGGKMGAGSGSDKRVAYTNLVAMSYADVLVITRPLYVIGRYNEWPKVKWAFRHELPTTLNEDKSGVIEN